MVFAFVLMLFKLWCRPPQGSRPPQTSRQVLQAPCERASTGKVSCPTRFDNHPNKEILHSNVSVQVQIVILKELQVQNYQFKSWYTLPSKLSSPHESTSKDLVSIVITDEMQDAQPRTLVRSDRSDYDQVRTTFKNDMNEMTEVEN